MRYKIKFGIRAYIYPLIALAVCLFMYLHSRKLAKAQATETAKPAPKVQIPTNTELKGTMDMDLPALYIFTDDDVPYADEIRTALAGKCSVIHIKGAKEDVCSYYGVKEKPCAVLFNKDRDKMADYAPLPSKEQLLSNIAEALK